MSETEKLPRIHYSTAPNIIPEPWASAYGQDQYGYWMGVEVNGIEQRFRWIHPGTFLMGSPEDELERGDDEILHPVEISQGYWLADTACTQKLWQAVMEDNPSHFNNDGQNPVENVSWDDCQKFIELLNKKVRGLDARLPSEAEWEYTCRAGTQTPFSFGDNITTDQVNYNGDYPYVDGDKGENRKTTIPVKKLPPNSWGLYQMHGNVWEWCQDWFGEFDKEKQVDPQGPETGEFRVLRGGSWNDDARYCRSAYRDHFRPGDRYYYTGLRLVRGSLPSSK